MKTETVPAIINGWLFLCSTPGKPGEQCPVITKTNYTQGMAHLATVRRFQKIGKPPGTRANFGYADSLEAWRRTVKDAGGQVISMYEAEKTFRNMERFPPPAVW